ncbi:MAG: kinase, partial [Erysipelotrichaceae bacterium]|nr:kinase [Erysipelotrichaceae bacterium]
MIITKTPFRMSFFGGGTDMKEFYEKYGGSVISTTFDKYVYVTVRHLPRFFTYKNQVTYSKIERTKNADEIEHPMVRNAMKLLDMKELIINYDADLPARTGLGSSSSFAVGLLNAFYCLKGKYADKRRLADDAIYVERVMCDEAGGLQDQIAASFGGFNRINFSADGYEVKPVIISPKRKEQLNRNLMFFFTGFTRLSSEIQKDTKKNADSNIETLLKMKEQVD